MSEQTGATPVQIEAAAKRQYENCTIGTWESATQEERELWIDDQESYARYLVPPGYRIVPAESVCITPEIAATAVEALPRVIAFLCGYGHSRPQLAADIIAITDLATSFEAAAAALRGEG